MRALSTRNDDPQHACRPFERDRDGFVIGEGAGILILEELELAKKRGAHIYAEIVGYGMTADAFHLTMPDETGSGAIRVMQKTIKDAGIRPEEVGFDRSKYVHSDARSESDAAPVARDKLVVVPYGRSACSDSLPAVCLFRACPSCGQRICHDTRLRACLPVALIASAEYPVPAPAKH